VTRTIVVVEDEALIAFDIQAALIGLGYEVPATAATTAEALEAVDTYRPDLVLMDVHLRGGDDGVATAAAIQTRRPTPVVFLSAYSDDATVDRAGDVDPYGYLLKPFNDRALRATVEIALRRHAREETLVRQRGLLAGVLRSVQDIVLVVDRQGGVLVANDAALRAVGAAPTGGGSRWTAGADGLRLSDGETPCPAGELPLVRALGGETVHDIELFVQSPSERVGRLYRMSAAPLRDPNGEVSGAVAIGHQVTDLRANESDARPPSEIDELTGALSRRGFLQTARAKLEAATASDGGRTLFFVDMNELKTINDTLGHRQGDRAIVDAVEVLRSCLRDSDIVGRLGGDEFVVLTSHAGTYAGMLRGHLQAALDDFNEDSRRKYRLSMSVGLCQQDPSKPLSLEALIEEADKRMYEDKNERRKNRLRG
jgi:diguanylate cyclase (GGDEF)-like protein